MVDNIPLSPFNICVQCTLRVFIWIWNVADKLPMWVSRVLYMGYMCLVAASSQDICYHIVYTMQHSSLLALIQTNCNLTPAHLQPLVHYY